MKRARSFVEKRREDILNNISSTPDISVEELAGLCHVSEVTVRRDLQILEDEKKIVRFYGGARVIEPDPFDEEEKRRLSCRDNIARYAAGLVNDNDTIFINTSATALGILKYINCSNVTVITNNARAVSYDLPEGVSVILTGGEIRYPKEAMVGEFAERNLQKVYAKKAFIGCAGISAECGVTTEIANEVNLNELMINRATRSSYVLADYTKVGNNSSFRTCSIGRVRHLITDVYADPAALKKITDAGVVVHQVSNDEGETTR
ncbi:MAG TPA: DeoR/GlpR family DNA-binding transcription regulator [Lachnospiraceae bacterium]|nr:DeoR/GlpR family DNA-binding transcription regulator [Lachnospiraceae bacterium]